MNGVYTCGCKRVYLAITHIPYFASPYYIYNKVAITFTERAQGLRVNTASERHPLQVRRLQAEHIPQVAQLGRSSGAAQWSEAQWHSGLQAGQHGWVLARGDEVYAFLIAHQVAHESELLLMATHPEYQRRGYATWLLNTWVQHAREQGVDQLHLEVRASNEPAQALYRHFGFESVGVRRDYYPLAQGGREDAYLLTKSLDRQ